MLQEDVDVVAGDFNGASWRRRSGWDQQFDSTLEAALTDVKLPVPPGPTPFVGARINSKRMDRLSSRPRLKRSGFFENMRVRTS